MKTIDVHIDRVILHGLGPIDRHQVGAALQRELARLIREQGLPPTFEQARTVGNMKAGEIRIGQQGSDSNTTGIQVAQTVYRDMKT